MTDEKEPGGAIEPAEEAPIAISDYRQGFLDGINEGKSLAQTADGGLSDSDVAKSLRRAALALSSFEAKLIQDPDIGTCISLPNNQFIDDQFAVRSFKEFIRDLRRVDPVMARELETGTPVSWDDTDDNDEFDIPCANAVNDVDYDDDL